MRRRPTLSEYVADRVEINADDCWIWTGHRNGDGYGVCFRDGKQKYVHRLTYELYRQPIPAGLVIDHLCRVRECCNPEHLEAVTHAENIRRGESPYAKKARKTHCVNGHPFDLLNTIWKTFPNGGTGRQCRACKDASARAWNTRHRPPPLDRTRCKRGHRRTPENGYVNAAGSWVCRVCARDRANGYNRAKGVPTREEKRLAATHCPHGHEYTAENTYWYERNGSRYRYCRECNRRAARRFPAAT